MVFTMCPFGKPQYTARAASDQARRYRSWGFKDAKAVRCPGTDHWHAVTTADDPIVLRAEARKRELAEWRARQKRGRDKAAGTKPAAVTIPAE